MEKIYHTEDSLEQKILAINMLNIKNQLLNFAYKTPKKEVCGFVVHDGENYKLIEVENKSQNPKEEFYIPSKVFLTIKTNHNIVCVFHSHPEGDCKPSEFDKNSSELVCLPFLILSIENRSFEIYQPEFNDSDEMLLSKLKREVCDD